MYVIRNNKTIRLYTTLHWQSKRLVSEIQKGEHTRTTVKTFPFLCFWNVKADDGCLVQSKHVAFWIVNRVLCIDCLLLHWRALHVSPSPLSLSLSLSLSLYIYIYIYIYIYGIQLLKAKLLFNFKLNIFVLSYVPCILSPRWWLDLSRNTLEVI